MNRFWTFYNLGSLENIKTVLRPVLKLVWSWHPIPVVISVAINTYWLFSYSLVVRIKFFIPLECIKSPYHLTSESYPLFFNLLSMPFAFYLLSRCSRRIFYPNWFCKKLKSLDIWILSFAINAVGCLSRLSNYWHRVHLFGPFINVPLNF